MTDKQKIIRLQFENKVLKQSLKDIKKQISNVEDLTATKAIVYANVKNPYSEGRNYY